MKLTPVALEPLLTRQHQDAVRALAGLLGSTLAGEVDADRSAASGEMAQTTADVLGQRVLDELSVLPTMTNLHRAAGQRRAA